MTRILLLAASLLLISAPAWAQPEAAEPTTPLQWYTSISGIGAATIFGVSMAKRALGRIEWFNRVPTWIYAVVIAFILTVLAVVVLGTLPGNVWQLAWQTVFNAAIASGVYEWMQNPVKPLGASAGTLTNSGRKKSSS
jgi:hypothetical protein